MSDYDPESAQWFYLKGGRQFGPVPERSIRAWLESGFLTESDLLWREGLVEWTPVHGIDELGGVGVSAGGPPPVRGDLGAQVDRTIDDTTPPDLTSSPGPPPEMRAGSAAPSGLPRSVPVNPAGTQAAGEVRYAGFWLRVGAFLIDDLLVNAMVSPLLLLRMKPGEPVNVWEPDPLVAVAFIGVYLLYGALCESSPWQATLGKRAWRIRVTGLAGNRVSPTQALVRQIAKVVSALGFGLGFFMAAISPRKQALHDWLSGCLVVKE